jgi:hypothetical protein
MKNFIIILGFWIIGFTSYGQTLISNDSIIINTEFVGRYTLELIEGGELRVSIIMGIPLDDMQRNSFEKELKRLMYEKNLFIGLRYTFQYFVDINKLSPSQIAGMELEEAGRSYNAAATITVISSIGGSVLVLNGFPVVGSVITLGGGLIGFILQITGNNKIIKGGKYLQKQR